MSGTDLFAAEAAALAQAQAALDQGGQSAERYQAELAQLVTHYRRLMRETRRLINHSDRTEYELNAANAKLQQLGEALAYKARHDTLTGALNRGAVFERAHHHLQQSTLALIVLDIDFFKRINDTFGHPTGDAVIQELVQRLRTHLAGMGEIGRVGGEEFTVLLPGLPLAQAAGIAESIRQAVAGQAFTCLPRHAVTASFGVSWSPPLTEFSDAYARADLALYRAKHGGRNRVETCDQTARTPAAAAAHSH